MSDHHSTIELGRSVDSIVIGIRHRQELGDIDALMKSIATRGLLQPITITPDGILVCGRRRLEAVKQLGWRTLKVWVRSGLSDDLSRILSQCDEQTLHKPLTPIEEGKLYEELSKVLAEDARLRQEESRFGSSAPSGGMNGGADSAPPSGAGRTRIQASQLVTGKQSHQRLEQINAVRRASRDQHLPELVRELAKRELRGINDGADVNPAYLRVKAAIELVGQEPRLEPPTNQEIAEMGEEALERVRQERTEPPSPPHQPGAAARRSVRAFVHTWSDLDGWTRFYDPHSLAVELPDRDWEMFQRVVAETVAFAAEVRDLRSSSRSGSPHPSAAS